jgi:hypothetical protein
MKIEIKHWFDDVLGCKKYHVWIDGSRVPTYEVNTTVDERSTLHGKWRFEHYSMGKWLHESEPFRNKPSLIKHIEEYHKKAIKTYKTIETKKDGGS